MAPTTGFHWNVGVVSEVSPAGETVVGIAGTTGLAEVAPVRKFATVVRVVSLMDRNEYKRRQAAPGWKITSKAFGVGRRYPVAADYGEMTRARAAGSEREAPAAAFEP